MKEIFANQLKHLVMADIVFGSPRRDCRNLGICKVDTSDPDRQQVFINCCPSAPAKMLMDAFDRLLILFPEAGLSEAVRAVHFCNDTFTVEDAYTLPAGICRLLGRPGGRLTVMPGKFPVLLLEEGFLLSLPLLAINNAGYGRESVLQQMMYDVLAG